MYTGTGERSARMIAEDDFVSVLAYFTSRMAGVSSVL